MANPLTEVLSGGFKGVLDGIGDVVGRFVTDPNTKLQVSAELTKVATEYQTQLLLADKELAVQQASVIVAEAKSDSWLAANWRPITMLTIVFMLFWNFIVVPIIGAWVHSIQVVAIPDRMWDMLQSGLQGYIYARSAEKILPGFVPGVIAAIKK
jgi:hypothetical protein